VPCDEDITHLDAHNTSLLDIQGPITRARARQLNLEMSLFLSTSTYNSENRLLPNDYIVIRNQGEDQEMHGKGLGGLEVHQGSASQVGDPIQVDFESTSKSRTVCLKFDAQTTYGVGFGRSIYIWLEPEFYKAFNGTGSTLKFLLSRQESSKQVDVQNLSGCCVTIFWAAGPCIVLEPVRVASDLHAPSSFLFSSHRHFRV
jgi:hypothetical protein